MHHVGNDIVDLEAPEARNKSTRFMEKIFSPGETRAVQRSARPHTALWAFWAAKETAYKAISKAHPQADFSPKRFHAELSRSNGNTLKGMVETPYGRVAVNVHIFQGHLHCIGITGNPINLDTVLWGYQRMVHPPACPSTAVRALALGHIARCCSLNPEDLEIRNNIHNYGTGPPVLYIKGEKAPIDISLSHDERFMGFAFVKSQVKPMRSNPYQPCQTLSPLGFAVI